MPNKPPAASFKPEIPKRVVDIPPRRISGDPKDSRAAGKDGKKLIVGRDICLSGEISACECLQVEGRVEATLSDGVSIEIAETGLYKGDAKVKTADVSGRFEGNLSAEHIILRASGTISGTVRYQTLEVEPGGRIRGDVDLIDEAPLPRVALATDNPDA